MNHSKKFFGLHPENPRYFVYKGSTVILITSTEHYGAVMNSSFDYIVYLDMLKEKGLNLTRIFAFNREHPGSCSGLEVKDNLNFSELGEQNTLAPGASSYIAPWERSTVPGCSDGGNKFDLDRWNDAYFSRLQEVCRAAWDRDIIVEVTFFSNFYTDADFGPWRVSPINHINNINGVGNISYSEFNNLNHPELVKIQEALVKRIVNELKEFDNIYYEICNEPNPMEEGPEAGFYKEIAMWQNHYVSIISELEKDFPQKHMIAVCDPNEHYELEKVSVLNFHYDEWAKNGLKNYYKYNKPLVFDETLTGVVAWNRPLDFEARRREAWEYLLKGFGGYDYLDFTIATDDPTGTGKALFPYEQYYNGETMRLYLKYLKDFIYSFDFTRMEPNNAVVKGEYLVSSITALVETGKAYAVYVYGSSLKNISLELPAGRYTVQWYNPRNGQNIDSLSLVHNKGDIRLEVPLYEQDIALSIKLVETA